jgi:hypothetical protein
MHVFKNCPDFLINKSSLNYINQNHCKFIAAYLAAMVLLVETGLKFLRFFKTISLSDAKGTIIILRKIVDIHQNQAMKFYSL